MPYRGKGVPAFRSPNLERVPLPLGHAIYESDRELRHPYFPTDTIVSLLHVILDGASAKVAVVGNEGINGIAQHPAVIRAPIQVTPPDDSPSA